ncbi:leucine-rich repeat-containing protein 51-like [Macrosteles quadrilineatus]|uniref:leucine-rich repeat-containing protein 51-like n=1 Tax=Macrosteles quadrilineatus TaxID=74068 RepID=UPI0023E2FA75|nr:leucine-rich repeat-containing protein 51-like [Macrosteles quadrilineatus]
MAEPTEEHSKVSWAVPPLDFSFKQIADETDIFTQKPSKNRLGTGPKVGEDGKYNAAAVWLGNNKLQTTRDAAAILNLLLVAPINLVWLDLSYNKIYDIDVQILHFKNLKILYLHGNVIYNLEVVTQLQPLQELRSLTLHGNPMDSLPQYRTTVLHLLPQLTSLDFVRVVRSERLGKPPQWHQDIVRGKKKSLPKD